MSIAKPMEGIDMSESTITPAALSFEDLFIGMERFSTQPRVVTREDVAHFAQLSGDINPVHTDDDFARSIGFEGIIAHGALSLAIATGLASQLGLTKEGVVFKKFESWEFMRTVKPGDSLSLKMEVIGIQPGNPDKPRRDPQTARLAIYLINQNHRTVQHGVWVAEFRPFR